MKLLNKTALFFLTTAFFVLFWGGILFYITFRYFINNTIKRELITEMHMFILNPPAGKGNNNHSPVYNLPLNYRITPVKEIQYSTFVFTDTLLFDSITGRYQPNRIIKYDTILDGEPVRVSIYKSLMVTDELVEYVAFITLALSLVLLLLIVVLNNYFFTRIWRDFFNTINIIRDFSIPDIKEINFTESEITEFNQLNEVIGKMYDRIKLDYQNLKEFIENISHEIQNPLAIIKSKADLLQQYETGNKTRNELVSSIQSGVIRLSNLNKSLILLSKIDNNQFPAIEEVDIANSINLHLVNFEDIIQLKGISLRTNFKNSLVVKADESLISIMLLNLLKNSIYHNIPSGQIEIMTDSEHLTIKNTGKKLEINPEDLFKRFAKSSNRPDSLGLGLAIVKKICDFYQYKIHYYCQDNYHIITISFK